MIEIIDISGNRHFVCLDAISSISEHYESWILTLAAGEEISITEEACSAIVRMFDNQDEFIMDDDHGEIG